MKKQAQKPAQLNTARSEPFIEKKTIVTPIHKFTQDSKIFNEFFFAYCSDTKQKQVSQKQRQRFQKTLIKASLDSTRQFSNENTKVNNENNEGSRLGSAISRPRTGASRSSGREQQKKDSESTSQNKNNSNGDTSEGEDSINIELPELGSFIVIHSSRLGKQSAIVLSKVLSTPEYGPVIRGLDLHENVIRDDGCIALCQSWLKGENSANRVYKIDFGSNDISPRGFVPLLDYLFDLNASSGLRELRLGSGSNDICVNKMDTKSAVILANALEINHSIRALDLNRNVGIGRQSQKAFKCFADAFKKHQAFEEIRLGEVEMSTHSAISILETLQNHENLSILDLHGNDLTFEIAKPLRRIIVPHRYDHTNEEKTQETSAVFQIESLEEDFDNSSPRKSDAFFMHDNIGMPFENEEDEDSDSDDELAGGDVQASKLSVLLLDGNNIGSKGMNILYPALKKNFSLKELNLMGNSIGEEGSEYIASYLETNNTLEILNLQDNHIGEKGVIAIASALRSNYILKDLNLSKNKCGDPGVAALGVILKSNNSLEYLNLALTGCGDAGALAIFQSLAVNYTIKSLNMSSNHLTDDSGITLEQTLKKAAENLKSKRKKSGIKSIILTGNQIDHTTLLRVKKIISKNIQNLQLQQPNKMQNELIRLKYITKQLNDAKIEYENSMSDRKKIESELSSVKDLIEQNKMKNEMEIREIIANIEIEKSTIYDNETKFENRKIEMEKSQVTFENQLDDLEQALASFQKKRKNIQDDYDICLKEYESYTENPQEILQNMKNELEDKKNQVSEIEKKKQKIEANKTKLLNDIEALKKKLKADEINAIEKQYQEELKKLKEQKEKEIKEAEEQAAKNQQNDNTNEIENADSTPEAPSLITNVEAEIDQALSSDKQIQDSEVVEATENVDQSTDEIETSQTDNSQLDSSQVELDEDDNPNEKE